MKRHPIVRQYLALGIIFLFLATSILPTVCGNETKNNTQNLHFYYLVVGIINNKQEIDTNFYLLNMTGFYVGIITNGGILLDWNMFSNEQIGFYYETKIGVFTNHVICGIFMFKTVSQMRSQYYDNS